MNRVVQITLVIAIVVGGFSVIRQRQMLSDLRKERNRLTAQIGDLSISDPEKFSVIRLATEENTEFLWNVYYPEKVAIRERVELAIG